MSTNIRLAMLCCVAVVASERAVLACSCAMRPVCAAFWEVDRVFTGRAEVTPLGPRAQRTRFRVKESFRGPPGGVVEIVSRGIGGSCAYAFVHGTEYLVYARRGSDGMWAAFFCDPTAPLDQATEGLAFARAVARDSRRGGQLLGSVLVVDRGGDGQFTSASPPSPVTITLRGMVHAFSAATDSKGQYEFKDIPPGRYALTVSALSGIEFIPPASIEIKGPGACATHVVTATKRPAQ